MVAGGPELKHLEGRFHELYPEAESTLNQLAQAPDLSTGETKNIKYLEAASARGIEASLSRLGADGRSKRLALITDFVTFGAKAVLLTGAQRGGDFLNNQLRGQWAENVALSMSISGIVLAPFGPSASAMPGEQDHRETVMTYRAITLLEGKRPDLLAFDAETWERLSSDERHAAEGWPERLLERADEQLVSSARAAIEVKNSTWHYGQRRAMGGGPLSITVKEEEVHAIEDWQAKTGIPVVFFQVLFDELYVMSFRRMCEGIKAGQLYETGDIVVDSQQGAGGKVWYRFHLDDERHRCGVVTFPDESEAVIRVLDSGSVVPYIAYKPAEASCTEPGAIETEIAF